MVNHSVLKALGAQQQQKQQKQPPHKEQQQHLQLEQQTLQHGLPFESSLHRLGSVSDNKN